MQIYFLQSTFATQQESAKYQIAKPKLQNNELNNTMKNQNNLNAYV